MILVHGATDIAEAILALGLRSKWFRAILQGFDHRSGLLRR